MSFRTNIPEPETDAVPMEDESLSTAQEAVPVPMWWGKRKVAVRWISPVYDQKAEQRDDRPSKK
jgi:hypothetical protein